MLKKVAVFAALVLTMLMSTMPFGRQTEAVTSNSTQPNAASLASQNKFVGHWLSHLTIAGQRTDEGSIYISDVDPPDANTVNVTHSRYGGTYLGYTFSYPDRIEIQIQLGNGRVAHYNGVLVSATRIEGYRFISSGQSNTSPTLGTDAWTSDITTPSRTLSIGIPLSNSSFQLWWFSAMILALT